MRKMPVVEYYYTIDEDDRLIQFDCEDDLLDYCREFTLVPHIIREKPND